MHYLRWLCLSLPLALTGCASEVNDGRQSSASSQNEVDPAPYAEDLKYTQFQIISVRRTSVGQPFSIGWQSLGTGTEYQVQISESETCEAPIIDRRVTGQLNQQVTLDKLGTFYACLFGSKGEARQAANNNGLSIEVLEPSQTLFDATKFALHPETAADGKIQLKWDAQVSDDVETVVIERSSDGQTWMEVASIKFDRSHSSFQGEGLREDGARSVFVRMKFISSKKTLQVTGAIEVKPAAEDPSNDPPAGTGTPPGDEDPEAIPAATNVTVSGFQVNSSLISWQDPTNSRATPNETGFQVEVRPAGADDSAWAATSAVLPAGTQGFRYSKIETSSKRFDFRIKAFGGPDLADSYSTPVTGAIYAVPAAPTIDPFSAGSSFVKINWSDPGEEFAVDYEIWRRTASGPSFVITSPSDAPTPPDLEFIDQSSQLRANTTYYYQVFARNPVGRSAASAERYVTTLQALQRGHSFSAGVRTPSSLYLQWQSNNSGNFSWDVQRSTDNSSWVTIAQTGSNSTQYMDDDPNLVPLTQYFYRVRATRDPDPEGPYSVEDFYMFTRAVLVASTATTTDYDNGDVTINWNDDNGDQSGFILERSIDAGDTWQKIPDDGNTLTTTSDVLTYTDVAVPTPIENLRYRVITARGDERSDPGPVATVSLPVVPFCDSGEKHVFTLPGGGATPADQTFTVPAEITKICVKLWGAGGASGYATANGGGGGFTWSEIDVTPGEDLTIIVGEGGKRSDEYNCSATPPSYGGGGGTVSGIPSGTSVANASGGGRSAIRRGTTELATAGGGGGGTLDNDGGAGGGDGGRPGEAGIGTAAQGAESPDGDIAGRGGSQGCDLTAQGDCIPGTDGTPGTAFQGGTSALGCGSGGGGGYHGGGGSDTYGSGGGGSGFFTGTGDWERGGGNAKAAPNVSAAYHPGGTFDEDYPNGGIGYGAAGTGQSHSGAVVIRWSE